MPTKESFDIDGLMVFRSDLTAVDQDGNTVASVTTPDKYVPSLKEPLSGEQIGRYTNTTAYWREHSTYIPLKGEVIIYSDGGSITEGGATVYIPKIKVGDGVTTIGNLPFTDSDTQQGTAGTLNTTNTTEQTPNASESLSGNVNLHKVSKTGSYDDLNDKPTIPTVNNATLTIQKNGTTIDTFTANAATNKTIDISVPVELDDLDDVSLSDVAGGDILIYRGGKTSSFINRPLEDVALPSTTKYAASLSLSINSSTFVITAQLLDQDGNNLGNAQTIDLPLESVVVSGSYNSQTKKVVLTLQNGSTIEFSVADLVAGLQSEITAQNPLSADLVVDGTNNKVFTAAEKTKLSGIESDAEVNVQADWTETDTTSDAYILHKPDLDATLYESVTYSQLVSKINNSQLVKGRKYRITDYVTTTTQTNTSSAGHAFDLVVTAIDVNKLDCKASALLHSGDTYFSTAGADLNKWQIWYDVNNDTSKYLWADSTNGKGVIYRMIDEHWNDCPYDFKNILSNFYDNNYVYTFNKFASGDTSNSDYSLNGNCFSNIIEPFTSYNNDRRLSINKIRFRNTSGTSFCRQNIIKSGCGSITFGDACSYNTICTNTSEVIFGNLCGYNVVGKGCLGVEFGDYCSKNNIEQSCLDIYFSDYNSNNTIREGCTDIYFQDSSERYGSYVSNVIVESGNTYIRLYNSSNVDASHYLRNIYISQGCSGTVSAYTEISTIARNLSYRTTVGRDSSGNIRIYNEDDPASASQAQSDWNETDNTDPAFIKNKPSIPDSTSDLTNDSGFITVNDVPQEVLVCTYNSSNNTMDKTTTEIFNAYSAGILVIAKQGESTFVCTVASETNGIIEFTKISNPSENNSIGVGYIRYFNSSWSVNSKNLQLKLIGSGTGQNIKTINNTSLLGSGNITIHEGDVNVQSDWSQTDNTADDYIKNKPTIPTVPTNVGAFTNDAGYITAADVPAQVNADWNATSGAAQILNKPTLTTVTFRHW